jgi:hypothetical protein
VNKKLNKRREREGGGEGGREGATIQQNNIMFTWKRKERKQIAVKSGEIWQERRNKIYLMVQNCVRNGVRSNLLQSWLCANAFPLQQ